jgi:hypothetical protein
LIDKFGGADRDRTDDLLNAMYVCTDSIIYHLFTSAYISRVFGMILIEEFAVSCSWLQVFTAQLVHKKAPEVSHGFRGFFVAGLTSGYYEHNKTFEFELITSLP